MSLFTWKLLKVGNDEPLTKNTNNTTRLQPNIKNATQAPEEDESAGRILDSETIRIQQGQSCIFPTMTPWDSMLRAMYNKNKPSPFPCLKLERNWVETDMGKLKIIVPGAKCNYTPIARIHENRADRVVISTMDVSDGDMLVSDFFDIFCSKDNGTYNNTHAAIAYNQSVIDRSIQLQKNSTQTDFFSGFNVLIFAFDSVARLAWIRALPKLHAYFVETLG